MQRGDGKDEEIVDEQVLEILRESIKQKLKKERKFDKKSEHRKALKATLQEFMTCGKLIGYDFDGNIIDIPFHNNKLEDNAMQNLFIQKFGEFMANRINIEDV